MKTSIMVALIVTCVFGRLAMWMHKKLYRTFLWNNSLKIMSTLAILFQATHAQDEFILTGPNNKTFSISAKQFQVDQLTAQTTARGVAQMFRLDVQFGPIPYELKTDFVVGEINAWYSPTGRVLNLPYVLIRGGLYSTASDLGISSHETGHMLLDVFQPNWLQNDNAHIGALHEAFGDLTTHFYRFYNLRTRRAFINNLESHNGCVGDNQLTCVRNNHDPLTLPDIVRNEALCEVHDLSRPFSNAVYDNMVSAYANRDWFSSAENVAGEIVAWHKRTLVHAVLGVKGTPTLMDIALQMLRVSSVNSSYREGLGKNFIANGLIVLMYQAPTTYYMQNMKFITLCQKKQRKAIDPRTR